MTSMPGRLDGAGILITRPARQAAGFARQVAAIGGTPLIFPAIVILPPDDRSALDRAQRELARYDFAVFVSANAVEYGVGDPAAWPSRLIAFAPGPGTASALAARRHRQRAPADHDHGQRRLARPARIRSGCGQARLDLSRRRRSRAAGRDAGGARSHRRHGRLLSPLTARGQRGGPRGGAWRGTHRCSDADQQRRPRQPLGAAGSLRPASAWPRRRRSSRIRALPRAQASWVSLESSSHHPPMPACSRHC